MFERALRSLPTDKLMVILSEDVGERKKIHSYLERNFPRVGKASLYCGIQCKPEHFRDYTGIPPTVRRAICECRGCNERLAFSKADYDCDSDGYGAYLKYCDRCDEPNCYEFSSPVEDAVHLEMKHNAVVIGKYVQGYQSTSKKGELVPELDIESIVFQIIEAPTDQINRKQLNAYVRDKLHPS